MTIRYTTGVFNLSHKEYRHFLNITRNFCNLQEVDL